MKKKIFISAVNGPIGYELVRELKKNFYVIGSDCQLNGLGTKICNKFILSPPGNSKNFLIFLKKISKLVDQIFLFADEEIFNLSKNRSKMQSVIKKMLISPHRTINLCNDKEKLKKYLVNKISLPGKTSNKVIIKPRIGRGSKNQLIIKTKTKKFRNFFLKEKNFIVEKFVEGKEFTIDCVFDQNHNLIFALPRERIIKSNVSIVGKIIKNNNIIKFIKKISKFIKFIGNINIQLIIDKNKKIYLTDINPRISGSIIFSIKSGFNPFNMANQILFNYKVKLPKVRYGKTFYRYWKTF